MKQCKHRYGKWCHSPRQEHQELCAFYFVNQNPENCSWFETKVKPKGELNATHNR
jgi:hypothetical protein